MECFVAVSRQCRFLAAVLSCRRHIGQEEGSYPYATRLTEIDGTCWSVVGTDFQPLLKHLFMKRMRGQRVLEHGAACSRIVA